MFVDAGNIFANDEPLSWSELKIGYGFGLRFDTPVGLFRGDIGFPHSTLQQRRPTTQEARFYFGFGHIF